MLKVKILLLLLFLGWGLSADAGTNSPDAIAIRVMPNTLHYSAIRWYDSQGFTGSPQSIEVDGYDAVRDGRSVYVNASNVSNNKLFTNIYIISFNQNSEDVTSDVFAQLLSHWTFNDNIRDTGICGISKTTCSGEGDCQSGQTCNNNVCTYSVEKKCSNDEDCATGVFCTSKKSRIIRDVKRLSDVAEVNLAIGEYKKNKGYYPKLEAGTYLTNRTISVWPSWKEKFAQEIGGYVLDPINKIGQCGQQFNQSTCWDESKKSFSGVVPSSAANNSLPAKSLVYTYQSFNKGASFVFCATMESGYYPNLYCLNGK